jgi:hypothetical protein
VEETTARFACPFEQRLNAGDVGLDDLARTKDRPVDVRLGGEVDHRSTTDASSCNHVLVGDVAYDQLDVRALEVCRIPGVGQLVEDDYLVTGRNEALDEVRADEASATGDEYAHRERVPTSLFEIRKRPC